MKIDEIWAYEKKRIEDYFLSKGACQIDGRLVFEGAVVVLDALPGRKMGSLALPQTRIQIEGPAAEEVYHGFYLNFLSGGA